MWHLYYNVVDHTKFLILHSNILLARVIYFQILKLPQQNLSISRLSLSLKKGEMLN